jgi:hypothetical protein
MATIADLVIANDALANQTGILLASVTALEASISAQIASAVSVSENEAIDPMIVMATSFANLAAIIVTHVTH